MEAAEKKRKPESKTTNDRGTTEAETNRKGKTEAEIVTMKLMVRSAMCSFDLIRLMQVL